MAGVAITTTVNARADVTRADGVWFLYFDLDQADVAGVTVTATLPDGTTASAVRRPGAAVRDGRGPDISFP